MENLPGPDGTLASRGYGVSSSDSASASWTSGSIHMDSASWDRITGILLCIGATKSLASVVTIVQDRILRPSGLFHDSHSPANPNNSPDSKLIRIGVRLRPLRFHS